MDFTKEPRIHAADAVEHELLRPRRSKNQKPSPTSWYSRWHKYAKAGVKGVDGKWHLLEWRKLPDGPYTTESAIKDFIDRLNGRKSAAPASPTNQDDTAAAMRELTEAGFTPAA